MTEARRERGEPDLYEPVRLLLRDLRARPEGLSSREAARRLTVYGPNELRRRQARRWPRELARQLTHPLALLLWVAAALSLATHTAVLTAAIVAVILLNAAFALVQEMQAERSVEMLTRYLPSRAKVLRDGVEQAVDARELVPGDVLVVEEGDRISADARLLDGAVEVDMSTLTGESLPVSRSTDAPAGADTTPLAARDAVFSGSTCLGGSARALVARTGMHTELGRIAALTERVGREESPLERQVKRVAWLIAAVATAAGAAFLPIGVLAAGLSAPDAFNFAIGLLVANVPEGLLPTITLALAVGVRELARRGAVIKRLSAVETLGSTTVICTDKTGTLTENRMRVVDVWLPTTGTPAGPVEPAKHLLARALVDCNNADLGGPTADGPQGDPTEVALLRTAAELGEDVRRPTREARRRHQFHFEPTLKLMSTVDSEDSGLALHVKGAPEAVLPRVTSVVDGDGASRPLTAELRTLIEGTVGDYAGRGLRILAVARRPLTRVPARREDAERDLTLLGVVAMSDPPRPEVPSAVAKCRGAGIRVIVVTGDHPLTAVEIARQVGIVGPRGRAVTGDRLDAMSDGELDRLLRDEPELVCARSSPETKLRITDSLRELGHVVAMTGDGVNDAPALRHADIGVGMGRGGTDVAREASTMVLTDDNFATIVTAVEAGRRVYDNVRKFILYIFAHAVPEVVPFLLFALSGGAVPLPLTVIQILAIDLGTETLPALALGREPAEPGIMARPPRSRREGVIRGEMLVRAWVVMGLVSAALVLAGFFLVLGEGGWTPGADVGPGTPLHHVYLQATTMTFAGIVACQIGTAFAARTTRASLRTVGLLSNRLLLTGIAFEVAFTVALVYLPPVQAAFGTAPLAPHHLAVLAVFPVVVWGVDELRRAYLRRLRA